MSISIYIAAPFSLQLVGRQVRDAFARHGIVSTARWLEEEPSLEKTISHAQRCFLGHMDLFDVRRAQGLVLLNPEEYREKGTGGRHVEVGAALAVGNPVWILGVRSNIFHWGEGVLDVWEGPSLDHVGECARAIKDSLWDYEQKPKFEVTS